MKVGILGLGLIGGSLTRAYAMEAWQLGVNDYLLEPITRESIQHTLENCS